MTFLPNYRKEYRKIHLYRSAISAFHEYIDSLPAGKHPRICSLASGVFNLRPPKPRYMFVWDIRQVLDFVKGKFRDNDQLSNEELTLKFIILLALTTSSRISAAHALGLNCMRKKVNIINLGFR